MHPWAVAYVVSFLDPLAGCCLIFILGYSSQWGHGQLFLCILITCNIFFCFGSCYITTFKFYRYKFPLVTKLVIKKNSFKFSPLYTCIDLMQWTIQDGDIIFFSISPTSLLCLTNYQLRLIKRKSHHRAQIHASI